MSLGLTEFCPVYAPFFGALGCCTAISLCSLGASYGTAKAGVGIASMGVLRPDLMIRASVPVVMAGIIGIYGLVVAIVIGNTLIYTMPLYSGFVQLAAGISVGMSGLAAGFAIGVVGDAGARGFGQQPRIFVGMILILIFAEVLAIYGFIVALVLTTAASGGDVANACRIG